jgi:moderate conductance mechanosensitive channel
MRLLRSDWDDIEDWLKSDGTDILLIVVVTFAAFMIFRSLFPRIARAAMTTAPRPPDVEMQQRAETIISVVDRTVGVLLVLVAAVTILAEFGVNVTAIVTGLGITGLALALGSQQLVKDGLNGMFLLAEDQYRTGDVVTIAGVTGTVEVISLRRTILRDEDGIVHTVPNGSITVVSNHTRDYAQVNVAVRVAVGEDLERVHRVVAGVAEEMAAEPDIGQLLVDPPVVRRVESVGNDGLTLTVSTRVRPAARWHIGGELRRRLSDAFLQEGVKVPYDVVDTRKEDQARGLEEPNAPA